MSTITTLNDWITGASFRWTTNTNFSNLNTDKAETSALTSWLAWKQDTITGLTASGAELNILDGATLTTTELNYVDWVTSAIQTQLNAKQATLVSWTNIKTINSTSILWSGDIVISGGGSVATDAIWDSKWDLAGGTGANTASRLAVGTNWQVLTADSAEATGLKWSTPAGGGDALTSGTLAQFASTTSLELKGVISDETGSGALVFANSPTLVTPVLWAATATTINGATITSGTLNGSVTGTNTWDQTIANTSDATSHTATLSATGWSIKLVEWSGITLTTTGTSADGIVTIASTWGWSGDVVWPASATDNAIARFDSTTGKLIQNSTLTLSDLWVIWWNPSFTGQVGFANTTTDSMFVDGWITMEWATYRQINDGGSNELIKFPTTSVAGAVNEFTISNAATGNWPILEATGWDTNIDVNITTKGTWVLKVNWSAIWTWNVTKVGTPVNNQVGVWTGDGTLEGDTALTFDTTTDTLATTLITATTVTANLVWNVTGNASGTAATVTSGTQAAITSAANLATVWTITSGTWNATDIAVADWGTWRSTGTTAYSLIATGTTATGAQQTLANGATTEVLVGGGASALPVWTTATGSWSPVRATSPTLVTPLLGTPTSWTLTNCTGLPVAGITASTSTALWVWSIELWHASDTSITRVSAWVVAVEGVNILLNWWALGTPSSGTLTSCTGLPVAGIAASTSTALWVGSIELGHASDTSIARVSAGVISVEGVTVPTISSTSTITNKRNQPRIVSAASYTTDTGTSLDFSTCDIFIVTAQAWALKFNNPSGSPQHWEKIMIRIKDSWTARALTYDTQYRAVGVTLPTTTVISKTLYLGGVWNTTDTKLDIIAVSQEV